MGFELTERVVELNAQVEAFMREHIYPREHEWEEFTVNQNNRWQVPEWFDGLREKAKEQGLWNLFLPAEYEPWSPGLFESKAAA